MTAPGRRCCVASARSGSGDRRWLTVIRRNWDGGSATDGELVPAGGASTLLHSCEAFVDEPLDTSLLSVAYIVSRTVAAGGFLIEFRNPFRLGHCAVVFLE
jgi:hypothetical protein